jgi:hypothetical protein
MLGFGVESFGRVMAPLAVICLLALSRVILARYHFTTSTGSRWRCRSSVRWR